MQSIHLSLITKKRSSCVAWATNNCNFQPLCCFSTQEKTKETVPNCHIASMTSGFFLIFLNFSRGRWHVPPAHDSLSSKRQQLAKLSGGLLRITTRSRKRCYFRATVQDQEQQTISWKKSAVNNESYLPVSILVYVTIHEATQLDSEVWQVQLTWLDADRRHRWPGAHGAFWRGEHRQHRFRFRRFTERPWIREITRFCTYKIQMCNAQTVTVQTGTVVGIVH